MLWWMLTAWQLSFIDRVNVGAAKLVGASSLGPLSELASSQSPRNDRTTQSYFLTILHRIYE